MLYYPTLRDAVADSPTSVALGFFDGLHRGHAAVITRAVAAKNEGLLPAVFTFTMHRSHPDKKPVEGYELITNDDKRLLLSQWGVGITLCPDFGEFREMDASTFVDEVLVKRLCAREVCCGQDFRFGRKASAGIEELTVLCQQHSIRVIPIAEVCFDGQRISSTWIRSLLKAGDVAKAAELLGRPFGYDFAVVEGKKLGRKLDFPTINQPIPPHFAAPRHGVYVAIAYARGQWCPAVTNVGLRPTVENTTALNSETYLCGFSGDLYGARVPVRLLEFLRPEQKFSSVEELRRQIGSDAVRAFSIAEAYLKTHRL